MRPPITIIITITGSIWKEYYYYHYYYFGIVRSLLLLLLLLLRKSFITITITITISNSLTTLVHTLLSICVFMRFSNMQGHTFTCKNANKTQNSVMDPVAGNTYVTPVLSVRCFHYVSLLSVFSWNGTSFRLKENKQKKHTLVTPFIKWMAVI